jgi:hypothetical protein
MHWMILPSAKNTKENGNENIQNKKEKLEKMACNRRHRLVNSKQTDITHHKTITNPHPQIF